MEERTNSAWETFLWTDSIEKTWRDTLTMLYRFTLWGLLAYDVGCFIVGIVLLGDKPMYAWDVALRSVATMAAAGVCMNWLSGCMLMVRLRRLRNAGPTMRRIFPKPDNGFITACMLFYTLSVGLIAAGLWVTHTLHLGGVSPVVTHNNDHSYRILTALGLVLVGWIIYRNWFRWFYVRDSRRRKAHGAEMDSL